MTIPIGRAETQDQKIRFFRKQATQPRSSEGRLPVGRSLPRRSSGTSRVVRVTSWLGQHRPLRVPQVSRFNLCGLGDRLLETPIHNHFPGKKVLEPAAACWWSQLHFLRFPFLSQSRGQEWGQAAWRTASSGLSRKSWGVGVETEGISGLNSFPRNLVIFRTSV